VAPPRRIDAHLHLTPPRYRERLERRHGGPLPPPWSRGEMVGFMDSHEIDAGIVSLAPPGVHLGDDREARLLARSCNEATAELVASDRRRFAGLAALPFPDVEGALTELDYALGELGLDGVSLLSNVGGSYLGEAEWEPLLGALDAAGAYVFLHPNAPPGGRHEGMPVWMLEFPLDTARAVAGMIYGGVFERFSRIRWQVGHLGGVVPFLAHRIASLADREPEAAGRAPRGALAYLADLHYDTGLSNHADVVELTGRICSPEKIVFGSDWPYLAPPAGTDPAPGLATLPEETRAAIDAANALALVPRLAS
jgi:predicted TIM-barrel fold metal-dependent hydrolase